MSSAAMKFFYLSILLALSALHAQMALAASADGEDSASSSSKPASGAHRLFNKE